MGPNAAPLQPEPEEGRCTPLPGKLNQDPDCDPNFPRYLINMRHAEIVVEAGRRRQWAEFCRNSPPGSIALDGYVAGLEPPDLSPSGPHINFNHHEDVLRSVTSATCLQVYEGITDHLAAALTRNGKLSVRAYVNHADPDVCLAIWLVAHMDELPEEGSEEHDRLEELVWLEDRFDRFAGAYPKELSTKKIGPLTWVFEPCFNSRHKDLDSQDLGNIIEAVCSRITAFVSGEGKSLKPKAGYQEIHEVYHDLPELPDGWAFIANEEPAARTKLRASGVTSFIALVGNGANTAKYTIGKFGPYVAIDLRARYEAFNAAESMKGNSISPSNRWDGSDCIGGSPIAGGSLLTPLELIRINNRLGALERDGDLSARRLEIFIADELPGLLSLPH